MLDFFDTGNKAVTQFNFALIGTTLFYSVYWFSSRSKLYVGLLGGGKSSAARWNVIRISGFFFMGIFPAVLIEGFDIMSLSEVGINTKWHPNTWLWLMILSFLTLVMNLAVTRTRENLEQYPQIRAEKWTKRTFIFEYGGWLIYLAGYEFLFRGVLLFGTIPLVGETAAIAINIALYSMAHMVKNWLETFGSVLLGLVLCYLTILSGSIWFALIIHILQAWINSFLSFRNHPEMRYARTK